MFSWRTIMFSWGTNHIFLVLYNHFIELFT